MKNEVGIEGSPLSSSPPTPPSPLPVSVGPGHEKYNFSASPSPSPPFSPPLSTRTSSTDNFLFIHNNAHLVLSSSNTKSRLPPASFSVDLPRFEDDPESQITSCLKDLLEWLVGRCCSCCTWSFPSSPQFSLKTA